MASNWPPDYMKSLVDWINRGSPNDNSLYGMWDAPDPAISPSGQVQPGEGGVDLGTPIGTPVYALATGPIIAAGYWKDNAHGVITQRVNVPGAGLQDLYYQHIQLDPSIVQCQGQACSGQVVQRGQRIGTIGPFNEIEMGFNSLWGGVWGSNHPGPWVHDPRKWLAALVTGNPAPVGSVGTSSTLGGLFPDSATITMYGEYIGIFLLALGLGLIGIYLLGGQPLEAVTSPVTAIAKRRRELGA